MQNTSTTITPTIYIFYPKIPADLQIPVPESMQYFEGFGYFDKKLHSSLNK